MEQVERGGRCEGQVRCSGAARCETQAGMVITQV